MRLNSDKKSFGIFPILMACIMACIVVVMCQTKVQRALNKVPLISQIPANKKEFWPGTKNILLTVKFSKFEDKREARVPGGADKNNWCRDLYIQIVTLYHHIYQSDVLIKSLLENNLNNDKVFLSAYSSLLEKLYITSSHESELT